MRYQLFFYNFVALLSLDVVSAALYPTRPVASTVWTIGKRTSVSWMDDGRKPHLSDMGSFNLDLYRGNDTYLMTLARHVDANKRSHSVFIPPDFTCNGSDYTLNFVFTNPPSRIYSADFTILCTSDTRPLAQVESATVPQAMLTLGLASAPTVTNSPDSATTIYAEPLGNGQGSVGLHNGAGKNTSKRVDLEKIKFRLVFILWPALIGISMAL